MEVVAEPVGELGVDEGDGLAEVAAAEGGAAAAGVVGDGDGEAFVLAPAQRAVLPRREWPMTADAGGRR